MSLKIHPLVIFLVSNNAFTIAAAYTSRHSPLRYVALALITFCAYMFPSLLQSYSHPTGWAGRVPAGAVGWNIISFFDRLILRGWDYDHYGPSTQDRSYEQKILRGKPVENDASPYSGTRSDFVAEVTGSPRGIGLFWEVKNVPYFADTRPSFVPSLGTFLFAHSIGIISCYYLHNWGTEVVLAVDHQYLSPAQIPFVTRLVSVSYQELRARIIVSIGYWVVQYALIQFFCSAAAVVFALLNPKGIKHWRPLFGSPRHAYTLRNFWGKSWHQNLRSGVEGLANFFAHGVLHLPKQGLLQRYTKILSGFFVSGFMHAVSDTGGGMLFWESGAMQFFCMQALGIMIEDCVQLVYKRYLKRSPSPRILYFETVVGYAWVLFFLIWTTPGWVFPVTVIMRVEDDLLSFDAVKPILFGR